MNWLLIALVIAALVVVFKFIHFNHLKHKILTIFLILLLAFLVFSFTNVMKSHSVDLKTAQGIFSASKIYLSWFIYIFGNIKTISGNAINMDWAPNNSSGSSGWDSSSASSGSGDGW